MILVDLLAMIVLGLLSAALSYYRKNYYVRVFDDILGREEDDTAEIRIGRGFLYGFFFPIYFVLLLTGLIALILFLILAGIIAAVVFVIVWVTERILPHGWFGSIVRGVFDSVGIRGPIVPVPPAAPSPMPPPEETAPSAPAPPPESASGEEEKTEKTP